MFELVALLIPITAIVMGCGLGAFAMHKEHKKRELIYKERLAAMEKGIPLPLDPEHVKNPISAHKHAGITNRKAFVILFFLGLPFLFLQEQDEGFTLTGLLLIFLSFAFLIISFFKYKISPEEKEIMEMQANYDQSAQITPQASTEKEEKQD